MSNHIYTEENIPKKLFLIYGEHDNELYLMDTDRNRAESMLQFLRIKTGKQFYFKMTTNEEYIRDIMC